MDSAPKVTPGRPVPLCLGPAGSSLGQVLVRFLPDSGVRMVARSRSPDCALRSCYAFSAWVRIPGATVFTKQRTPPCSVGRRQFWGRLLLQSLFTSKKKKIRKKIAVGTLRCEIPFEGGVQPDTGFRATSIPFSGSAQFRFQGHVNLVFRFGSIPFSG